MRVICNEITMRTEYRSYKVYSPCMQQEIIHELKINSISKRLLHSYFFGHPELSLPLLWGLRVCFCAQRC